MPYTVLKWLKTEPREVEVAGEFVDQEEAEAWVADQEPENSENLHAFSIETPPTLLKLPVLT